MNIPLEYPKIPLSFHAICARTSSDSCGRPQNNKRVGSAGSEGTGHWEGRPLETVESWIFMDFSNVFLKEFLGFWTCWNRGFFDVFVAPFAIAACLSLASSFVLEAVGSRLQPSTAGLVKILGMGSTATNKGMKEMRDWLHATRDLLPQSSTTGMITALMLEPARPRAWFRRQQVSSSETYESDVRTVVTETSETKQPEWFRWDEMAEVTGSQQAKRGTRFLH